MKQNKRNNFHRRYETNSQRTAEPRGYGVLPAPGILESYEELAPGAVGKIIEMARLEQEHRQEWENNYLRYMAYITKIGQLLGFMLAAIVTFTALSLVGDGEYAMAIFITVVGYSYLMASAYISFSSRKILPKPARRDDDRSNQSQQQNTGRNQNYYRNRNRNHNRHRS